MVENTLLNSIRRYSTSIKATISDQEGDDIIREYFPGVRFDNLARQLQQAALLFGIEWEVASWEFSNGSGNRPLLVMLYEASTIYGNILLERTIVLRNRKLIAKHSYLEIPDELQANGFSRFINRLLVKFYKNTDISKIELYASLDVGGYVWAVAGFAATRQDELLNILKNAQDKLGPGSSLMATTLSLLKLDVAMHFSVPQPASYPIYNWIALAGREQAKELLLDTSWHGELNLADDVQMSNFEDYINKEQHLIKPW